MGVEYSINPSVAAAQAANKREETCSVLDQILYVVGAFNI